MLVVINETPGGFGLPDSILEKMIESSHLLALSFGKDALWGCEFTEQISRHDPMLIELLKENCPKHLRIIEIPDDVDYVIERNDVGQEWIAEKHRTWGL